MITATRTVNYDDVIRKWWADRFPDAAPPKWNSAMTCADASDLLRYFHHQVRAELSEKGKP